ncbi:response regulator [Hamadaea tsunoensis]|uniref:response regulator n=1 Tax=Hamadaea tsunoensis TaxID=53368 RepID=UPI000487E327|nr:response regulator [Hamadaea tsunoensis]
MTAQEWLHSAVGAAGEPAPPGAWSWPVTAPARVSDNLCRLYGVEPDAFTGDPSFFAEHAYAEDRDAVLAALKAAGERSGGTEFEHRIVTGGRTRWLRHTCDVLPDATVVGVVTDVTRTRQSEVSPHGDDRFRTLLASVPDAVVGIDGAGLIVLANQRTEELFGYTEAELVGQPVEKLIPQRFHRRHTAERDRFLGEPRLRPMGAGLDLYARRRDGSEFPVEIALSPLRTKSSDERGHLVVAAVRDATEQRRAQAAAQALKAAQVRRKQALEINDNVVQSLAAATFALERGDASGAERILSRTIVAAREMMRNLLGEGAVTPGELVRDTPAQDARVGEPFVGTAAEPGQRRGVEVLVADDSADIRLALRAVLESMPNVRVVAEAGDGAEAVLLTANRRPDLVVLDLAMPVMDGLQALNEIRRTSPEARVIVLTGYGREQAAQEALRRGAAAFLEKGGSTRQLVAVIRELFPDAATGRLADPGEHAYRFERHAADQVDLVGLYAHELRSPVAAVEGIAHVLNERLDHMPSAASGELLKAMLRNLRQIGRLIETMVDARRLESDDLDLVIERVELAALVRDIVRELSELSLGHPMIVNVAGEVRVGLDSFRIRQVLANLLSNAAKFGRPGTPIELTLAVVDAGRTVELSVTDQGPGVPEADRDLLFGKFVQLGERTGGVGLGLYLSRAIARAHGGDLVLGETSSTGSTFVVRLPALDAD